MSIILDGPKIILERLAYVIYQHEHLESFTRFAADFGLLPNGELGSMRFFKGTGKDQYVYIAVAGDENKILGAGFGARTKEDFERACQVEGAQVIDTQGRPGGGSLVSIPDPNGCEVQIIWGQQPPAVPPQGVSAVDGGRPLINGSLEKPRKGCFQRLREGPALVHKLGHFGYMMENYAETCAWYQKMFNIVPSDSLHSKSDENEIVVSFLRLDLGKEYVDHHMLIMQKSNKPGIRPHHSSFEVEDTDTQFMGHDWLVKHGHKLAWGVGRHILGSQVFDYWFDSSGFIVEHYADGDQVNDEFKTTKEPLGHAAIWGPEMPRVWD